MIEGKRVALFQGRGHYYERGDAGAMRIAIDAFRALGGETLLLTNAAGGLRQEWRPPALVAIADHINFSGANPLIGYSGADRFTPLTKAYDEKLRAQLHEAARGAGVELHEGVYMWFSGPSFETPAEIRAARILGADLVGMSTVPEVILGRRAGLRCAAVSVVTNYAAGLSGGDPSHEETQAVAAQAAENFKRLLRGFIHSYRPPRASGSSPGAGAASDRARWRGQEPSIMILPQEIIRAKRDGQALSAGEIGDFIAGLTSGAVTEGQAAAFAMAVFFRGMSLDERVALTRAMTRSGSTLDWREAHLDGPILDKHSTGGVGDNVSLMLAPMLAAAGAYVPMISGRGLGHTGGTLDKLDSIPGYTSQPDLALFRNVVRQAGCAIIGQTEDLAPADRRLYAIRDVSATVESVALITASILSKKLAAGLQGLVMDVKTGSGAFMTTLEGSRELATSIAAVASDAGLPTVSLITDMNEPLASAAGNAVEIMNAVDYLTGKRRDARLDRVTMALGAELLALSGLARDVEAGQAALKRALDSGAAAERFERMVAALGGPRDFVSRAHGLLPRAPVLVEATPARPGFVVEIDVRAVGLAVVELGGGRARAADAIDPAVGLTELAPIGAEVSPDLALARVHARSAADAEAAVKRLRAAYRLGEAPAFAWRPRDRADRRDAVRPQLAVKPADCGFVAMSPAWSRNGAANRAVVG